VARATNIYLVVRYDYDGVEPMAAFTVKHEMASWLREHDDGSLEGCGVLRLPDGGKGDATEMKIEDLI
jgi:hypothetical protein